ncbi:unnamed protein product [Dicrocoelium dendriticum]|nr:unnamed protein product [Dicrocoelium dendriticum]
MVGIVWLWALTWSSPPLFGFGRYIAEGFHTSCTFDYISTDMRNLLFNAGMYIFGFSVPVFLIIFCYCQIVRTVRHSEHQLRTIANQLDVEGGSKSLKMTNRKSDIEATKTAILLVIFFLAAWTPYAVVCLMTLIGWMENLTPFGSEIPVLFAKTSAVYNPFIYAIRHPKFRGELNRRFPFLLLCCPLKVKVSLPSNC